MKQPSLFKRKWNYSALSFLLPVIGLLVVRLFASIFFEGTYSLLYSDCYHQYYPFFLEFRRALRSGESLLFNWTIGMGTDFVGLIAYYLGSPLNLITVILPEGMMMAYFSAMMPIKLGLASLFFATFLKKVFKKNDFSIVVFGCLYGLCAWALGYQWNIMWLDTFALLPLVVLGAVCLLTEKKFILYTISLFLSVAINYYIGLFTCIFILLLFICYQICRWQGFKKLFGDLLRFAVFSILAIGMTAFLELPALAALQTTQSSVNKFPSKFYMYIASSQAWHGLFDAMRKVAGNANILVTPTQKNGLPNIYCGVCANILAFLFLTSRKVKLRDKLVSCSLLLFFTLSFIIRQLDYIWHGFHFTNEIPHRFSFLYSFVVLYMAYRAWLLRKDFKPWQVTTALALSLCLVFCSQMMDDVYALILGETSLLPWSGMSNIGKNILSIGKDLAMPIGNLFFIVLYGAVLFLLQRKPALTTFDTKQDRRKWLHNMLYQRRLVSSAFLAVIALEIIANLVYFGVTFNGTNLDFYPRGKKDAEAVLSYMHEAEADTLFYRAETAHTQTFNDGALNDYNGVTAFTSSANVKVTEYMKSLGYAAKNTYNRYAFEESSPVANLFLNLKYMIERDGSVKNNHYFDPVFTSGKVTLLKNNAYLPLGFLTEPQLINLEFTSDDDPFGFQNELLSAATGNSENVWEMLEGSTLTILGSGVELSAYAETGYCYYTATNSDCKISYSYTADKSGLMCFHLDQSKRNKFAVYVNGSESPLYSETYSLPQMLSVCQVEPGDVVEIEMTCTQGDNGTISIDAAVLNESVFRKAYDSLAASTLELTEFKTTYVEGTIQCDRDGVLYTSIPQNGNWSATVDGEPAQIVLIGDVMVGLILSEGEHTVSFQYHNKAFALGWKVSLVCFLIFGGLVCYQHRDFFRRRKGKFED